MSGSDDPAVDRHPPGMTLRAHDKTQIALRHWLLGRNYFEAVRAMDYAQQYHTGLRKDGITPEFGHQVAIAHYMRTLEPSLLHPEATLITVFLHDVPEDYDVTLGEIGQQYGPLVREAVGLLTKKFGDESLPAAAYYRAIGEHPIASLVKGGDRIHNLQSMPGVFSYPKQVAYIEEAEVHLLPALRIARRRFPAQELAYENIKHMLRSQIELLRAVHAAASPAPPSHP